MSVTAPGGIAALAGWAGAALLDALKQAGSGEKSGVTAVSLERAADLVVMHDAAPMAVFREMVTAGLRQLEALLPVMERQLAAMEVAPLGHLARSVGDAAHSVGAGFAAIAGDEEGNAPAVTEHWRGTAGSFLRQASLLLADASERLQPELAHPHPEPEVLRAPTQPDLLWATLQVAGAQRQVAASLRVFGSEVMRRRDIQAVAVRRWTHSRRLDPVMSALAVFGLILLLIVMALAIGAWFAVAIIGGCSLAIGAAALWGWRVVVGARAVRIELRREKSWH